MAEDQVAVGGEVLGQVLERLLEGDAAGGDLAVGVAGLRHGVPTVDDLRDLLKSSFLLPSSRGTTATATKGEQTRQAILDAAIARFGRDGYRATSVADIARDAGVGGTVAYAYFPSKEALFLAAIDEDAAARHPRGAVERRSPSPTSATGARR